MTDDIRTDNGPDLDGLVSVTPEEVKAAAGIPGMTAEMLLAEKRAKLLRDAHRLGMTPAELVDFERRHPIDKAKLAAAAAEAKLTPARLAKLDAATDAGRQAGRGTTLADWAKATGRDPSGKFVKS